MKTFLREFLLTLFSAAIIFLILQTAFQTFVVIGISMKPTLQEGQRLLVNKIVYKLHQPERGDVIVFEPPQNGGEDYVKRLVAIPGDKVEIQRGTVYINGESLSEDYINENPRYNMQATIVEEGEYFVLGDNRNHSNDSHNGWKVPQENIIGKAWLSIWPPGKWGLVTHHPLEEQLSSPTQREDYIGKLLWR